MAIEASDLLDTFDTHWEDIYASGQQLNRWPYDHVISFLKRGSTRLGYETDLPLKLLEVGFGAGNNLLAAATEGFSVAGIEASPSAVEHARNRFATEGVAGDLLVGDFIELPWAAESFDLVVDRLALTNSTPRGIRMAVGEVHRVLRVGGFFQFNAYGLPLTAQSETTDELSSEGMAYRPEMGGSLAGVGGVTLFDEHGVRSLFPEDNWTIEAFQEVITRGVGQTSAFAPNDIQSEWRVVARKRGKASLDAAR